MQINPKLLDKIKEAVPSIMRLGFGCEVEYTEQTQPRPLTVYENNRIVGKVVWIESKDVKMPYRKIKVDSTITTIKDIKIIGRTITLADVLLTVKNTDAEFYFKNDVSARSGTEKIVDRWNLKNNDITQQPQILIDLLEKILL